MGVYLSTPCMEFSYDEGQGNGIQFFVGEMQGWRKNMEDAHIAYDDLSVVSQVYSPEPLSLFGVFDGHGGKEVAKFAQEKFAAELTSLPEFKEGRYEASLRRAFHRIDELLEDTQFDPLLERFRQIPNPSDRDRRNTANSGRATEAGGYKTGSSQAPLQPAAPPQGPIGPTITPMTADPEKKMALTTTQTMEMLQQLLVRDDNQESEASRMSRMATEPSPTLPSMATPVTATTPAEPPKSTTPVATAPVPTSTTTTAAGPEKMVCQLKDHRVMAGCTAVVALKRGNTLYVANAGDSRGVLCGKNRVAVPLSEDHKPNQPRELARIQSAGGFVTQIGRVNGNLNLSRSLGDLKYKQVPGVSQENQIISAEPDVTVTQLQPTDQFLILACDGVWDCMTNQQAVDFVATRLDEGMALSDIVNQALRHCVADDPRKTGGLGGDNMTFMVILLQPRASITDKTVSSGGTVGEASGGVPSSSAAALSDTTPTTASSTNASSHE